jgi:hypothetical protein
LDNGPDTCSLSGVLDQYRRKGENSLSFFLGFSNVLKFRAAEFAEVLKEYEEVMEKKKTVHQQLTSLSVVRWIHYTNKLEFAGFEDIADTQAAILSGLQGKGSLKERETLQTFHFLNASIR